MPKRWSTKTLSISTPATAERTGVGTFECTDDYSVFHYSKMPDQIAGKGEALCRMAITTFGLLDRAGIPTHLLGFTPPNRLQVRLVRVIDPVIEPLTPRDRSRLIPLQVVCRNTLPEGSSVFRRLDAGTLTLAGLGMATAPVAGHVLDRPMVEFSTKLEEIDRYVSEEEAQRIAGLSDQQFAEVHVLALRINDVVTEHAQSIGLTHADSKVEFGIDDEGRIILVDTAGTPDENRFLWNGFHVSKQILRDHYHGHQLEDCVQQWAAAGRSRSDWPTPASLPDELIVAVSAMFKSISNRWTGAEHFAVADLDSVIEHVCAAQRHAESARDLW